MSAFNKVFLLVNLANEKQTHETSSLNRTQKPQAKPGNNLNLAQKQK